jgi:hypothetical protein
LVAAAAGSTLSVCLHSGATLIVTFDKSAGSWGGTAGAWTTYPPVAVAGDPSVLKLSSDSPQGQRDTAVFEARSPGTTWVTARFDVSCSNANTTPCTIPPEGQITVNATVVPK